MQNVGTILLMVLAVGFLGGVLVLVVRTISQRTIIDTVSSGGPSKMAVEQGRIRSVRGIMLADLNHLRVAFVAAVNAVKPNSSAEATLANNAIENLDRFKMELEASPVGDYSSSSQEVALEQLQRLRGFDEDLQIQLKGVVEEELQTLSASNGAGASEWFAARSASMTSKLDNVRTRLRERQRFATTLKT